MAWSQLLEALLLVIGALVLFGVWFLVLVGALGATALGLTVVNVGTLYRLRYVFWALFVVAAADTISRIVAARLAARDARHTNVG